MFNAEIGIRHWTLMIPTLMNPEWTLMNPLGWMEHWHQIYLKKHILYNKTICEKKIIKIN